MPGISIFVAVRTAPDGGRTAVDGWETMPTLS
jgi:hypothetical protein